MVLSRSAACAVAQPGRGALAQTSRITRVRLAFHGSSGGFVRTGLQACCARRVGSAAAVSRVRFGNSVSSGSFRFCDGPWLVPEAPFLILPIFGRR
jgi:hypothetical protein